MDKNKKILALPDVEPRDKRERSKFRRLFTIKKHRANSERDVIRSDLTVKPFLNTVESDWENPNHVSEDDNPIVPSIKSLKILIDAELILISRSPITNEDDFLNKIDFWVDNYEGFRLWKPYHTLTYILLCAKLTQDKTRRDPYIYKSKVCDVINFGISSDFNLPSEDRVNLRFQLGRDSSYFSVSYVSSFKTSKKQGTIYPFLYSKNGQNLDFKKLSKRLNLNVDLTNNGLLYPIF